MHELSIAQGIVGCAEEAARENGMDSVCEVTIRLGALAGVVKAALEFSWELVSEGTICEGAKLTVQEIPVRVWCEACRAEVTPPEIYCFRCPTCHALTPDVRQGRELTVVQIRN